VFLNKVLQVLLVHGREILMH